MAQMHIHFRLRKVKRVNSFLKELGIWHSSPWRLFAYLLQEYKCSLFGGRMGRFARNPYLYTSRLSFCELRCPSLVKCLLPEHDPSTPHCIALRGWMPGGRGYNITLVVVMVNNKLFVSDPGVFQFLVLCTLPDLMYIHKNQISTPWTEWPENIWPSCNTL